jgi:exosortase
VRGALSLSLHDDRYVQIVIAPFLVAVLIYWHRVEIFAKARYSPRFGAPLFLATTTLCGTLTFWQPRSDFIVLLTQSAGVLLCVAAFFLCFGDSSFKAASYSLGCLLLMIPVPTALMDQIRVGLQHGSAEVSYAILRLTGTPVFRQGMRFTLPGLDIEIAPECSGIRSGLIFFMLGILTAGLYLRSGWRKVALILATIPISIFKNAVRIVTLSLLSIYIDRSFLLGPIHHKYGGLLSLPLDLLLFVPLVLALRKSEGRSLTD